MAVVRLLDAGDKPALREFECAPFGEPWAKPVEGTVRWVLPGKLADGEWTAVGLWSGRTLCGLTAWSVTSDPLTASMLGVERVWRGEALAVHSDHRRLGYGRLLTERMIEEARGAGVGAIVSVVHSSNGPTNGLSRKMGAVMRALGPSEPDPYRWWVVLLGDEVTGHGPQG